MSTHSTRKSWKKPERAYSRLGTFVAISLCMFAFVVVGIKLLADQSPVSAIAYYGLGLLFVVIVAAAFMVPVTQRERAEIKARPPMELDPLNFDPTRDGLPW
ncbi:MAG TPA: hypothetical protein VGE07_09250 [Herpetosiphonaceae bacterium]